MSRSYFSLSRLRAAFAAVVIALVGDGFVGCAAVWAQETVLDSTTEPPQAAAPNSLRASDDAKIEALQAPKKSVRRDRSENLRGVWVSTVWNLDYPSKKGLSANALRQEADALLDRIADLGLNAVFLQVRPMGDAIYPSKIYPRSVFISGKQGVAPDEDFDVLAYWIKAARRRDLQLHAWINPYRVTTGKFGRGDLAPTNPAVLRPELTFEHDGAVFLDPGIPEVRDLVVAGMVEIVENYDVDGIHIDDYFYPERDVAEDAATFEQYGADFDNIEDWRRNNVDLFVEAANKAIHKARPDCVWSVSPAGIWANKSSDPLGSETRGNESYYNLFADVRGWVKKEWIDAVIPQIYWHIGYEIADFRILTDWWSDVVRGTNVRLYVGTAAYRVDTDSKTKAWRSPVELIRQLDYMRKRPDVSGQVFFSARSLAPGKPAGDALRQYAEKRGALKEASKRRRVSEKRDGSEGKPAN